MGEIINLRQARKTRARAADRSRAAENRALHGQTAAARQMNQAERDRAERLLDGSRRDAEPED